MKINNKKGAEKILSVYWFAILVIIAGAVVAMVSLFYGYPYDVREMEANIMVNQVSNCLSNSTEPGRLNQKLFFNNSFDQNFSIFDECDITFETETKFEPGKSFSKEKQYYLKIKFYNLVNNENVFNLSEGNPNLVSDYEVDPEEQYKRLVKGVERYFYSVGPSSVNEVYKINVLSLIRKTEKNVK